MDIHGKFGPATIEAILINGIKQPERSIIAEKAAAVAENLGTIVESDEKFEQAASNASYNDDIYRCKAAHEFVKVLVNKRVYKSGTFSIYEETTVRDLIPEERKIEIRSGLLNSIVYEIIEDVRKSTRGIDSNITLRLHQNSISQYRPGKWEKSLDRIYQRIAKD